MEKSEIKALIYLLDDPDTNIYAHVEEELINKGTIIIPLLEEAWEKSFDPLLQSRIENLIDKMQFDQIKNELQLWALYNTEDLLDGLLIINRYQYPNLDDNDVHYQIADLRRQVWYGLMYEMNPVQKVKLLNNIIFTEFGLSGNTSNYHDPQNSFIAKVLESKKGNPISIASIYIIIAQRLDIPIYGINLPKHFIVAYMDEGKGKPLFYINVFNKGQIMRSDDIEGFLKQLKLPIIDEYTMPCSNITIVKRTLRNLSTAYENAGNSLKHTQVNQLLNIIEDYS